MRVLRVRLGGTDQAGAMWVSSGLTAGFVPFVLCQARAGMMQIHLVGMDHQLVVMFSHPSGTALTAAKFEYLVNSFKKYTDAHTETTFWKECRLLDSAPTRGGMSWSRSQVFTQAQRKQMVLNAEKQPHGASPTAATATPVGLLDRRPPDAELVVPPAPAGNLLSISPPPGLPPPQPQQDQQQEPPAYFPDVVPLVNAVREELAARAESGPAAPVVISLLPRQLIERVCQPHKRFQLVPESLEIEANIDPDTGNVKLALVQTHIHSITVCIA